MSKYAPLESHLRESGQTHVPMTFKEIEDVIGTRLPASAFEHRALWSNNPANWVMTKAWLAAGYKTGDVDIPNRKLVFRRVATDVPSPPTRDRRETPRGGEPDLADSTASFTHVFGALRGTVTIAPGTDLTDPVGERWDAAG